MQSFTINFNRVPPFEDKLINQHYASHRHRIEEAKSKVDTSSVTLPASKTKPNKLGLSLARENDIFKNKIQRVINARPRTRVSNIAKNNNGSNRNVDQSLIFTDNSRVFSRLQTSRSHYPRGQYLADFQKKEKLLGGISRFPNARPQVLDSSPTSMVLPTVLPPIGRKERPRQKWIFRPVLPKIPSSDS